MFTGIIQGLGVVRGFEKRGESGRITIETSLNLDDIRQGDSIAVDGVCLSVVGKGSSSFDADISEETLRLTTLGYVERGTNVNLEKSLRASDPIGGHLVTGHIDGTGIIARKTSKGDFFVMEFNLLKGLMKQVVRKGSIAIDGISLTVADLLEDGLRVHIIPHTLKVTNLSVREVGDRVNVETDIIGKYVERFLSAYPGKGIDEGFLVRHGFLKGG
ncbi:MAG: riboflavin synthase [Deltaproteobacteria bacterium]|nr:riboflavin synthase [Deltaproteobacteria bacterium]